MFLYTNNKISEKEVNNDIDNNPQNKKIVRNKFKEVKDLYTENSKTLMKETVEVTRKWKDILCSLIRINTIKIALRLKAIYWVKYGDSRVPHNIFESY